MSTPFIPTAVQSPVVSPAIGSTGAPPLPYVSNSQYQFAPTGVSVADLNPGGLPAAQQTSLAEVIRRASRWVDSICFGSDAATKGASLAASLTVDQATIRIKRGELRLICDYRPLVQLVGVATGWGMSSLTDLDPSLIASARVGRRTFYLPFIGPIYRSGDQPAYVPNGISGSLYTVWSYVNGYPHTSLAQNVAQGATGCVVNATDGNGGLWGVYPASGAFPGTQLVLYDAATGDDAVFVQSVTAATPSANLTTLVTSAFSYAHNVPNAPDFVPVSAIPENVQQAAISLVSMLVKTRGARSLVMPRTAGGAPSGMSRKQMAQSGVLEDFDLACQLLNDGGLVTRIKHTGSY